MDYSIKEFDKQYLLHTPTSFLLKNSTIENLASLFDDNGWTVLHYAVAEANVPKITEFLHFNMNTGTNSKRNFIPSDIYILNDKKKSTDKIEIINKIPFSKNGFTPIHLALFLYNYYTVINKQLGNDFFYSSLVEKYQKILSLFIKGFTKLEETLDIDGKSLFDYAFLLENITLIELLHMNDHEFQTLRKVDYKTAKKILEVMELKHKEGSHEHLLGFLNTVILKTDLDSKLPQKDLKDKINKI